MDLHFYTIQVFVFLLVTVSLGACTNHTDEYVYKGNSVSLPCEAQYGLTWQSDSVFSITLIAELQHIGTVVHDGHFSAEIQNIEGEVVDTTLSFTATEELDKLVVHCRGLDATVLQNITVHINYETTESTEVVTVDDTTQPTSASTESQTPFRTTSLGNPTTIIGKGRKDFQALELLTVFLMSSISIIVLY